MKKKISITEVCLCIITLCIICVAIAYVTNVTRKDSSKEIEASQAETVQEVLSNDSATEESTQQSNTSFMDQSNKIQSENTNAFEDNPYDMITIPNTAPNKLTPLNPDDWWDDAFFSDDNYLDPITYVKFYDQIPEDESVLFRGRLQVYETGIFIDGFDGCCAICVMFFDTGYQTEVIINYGDMALSVGDIIDVYGYYYGYLSPEDISSLMDFASIISPVALYYVQ